MSVWASNSESELDESVRIECEINGGMEGHSYRLIRIAFERTDKAAADQHQPALEHYLSCFRAMCAVHIVGVAGAVEADDSTTAYVAAALLATHGIPSPVASSRPADCIPAIGPSPVKTRVTMASAAAAVTACRTCCRVVSRVRERRVSARCRQGAADSVVDSSRRAAFAMLGWLPIWSGQDVDLRL